MKFVVDTNVIISSLYKRDSISFKVLTFALANDFYYANDILNEYRRVLHYPHLKLTESQIDKTISLIINNGHIINSVNYIYPNKFRHEDDRKFYELAKEFGAYLITGNKKDFPNDQTVMSPSEFLKIFPLLS